MAIKELSKITPRISRFCMVRLPVTWKLGRKNSTCSLWACVSAVAFWCIDHALGLTECENNQKQNVWYIFSMYPFTLALYFPVPFCLNGTLSCFLSWESFHANYLLFSIFSSGTPRTEQNNQQSSSVNLSLFAIHVTSTNSCYPLIYVYSSEGTQGAPFCVPQGS